MLEAFLKCLAILGCLSVPKSEVLGSGLGALCAGAGRHLGASMQDDDWVASCPSLGETHILSFRRDCLVYQGGEAWGGHLAGEEVMVWGVQRLSVSSIKCFSTSSIPGPSSRHL